MAVTYVRLKGLKPEGIYEDAESRRRYSGAALMYAGLTLPQLFGDAPSAQLYLKKL